MEAAIGFLKKAYTDVMKEDPGFYNTVLCPFSLSTHSQSLPFATLPCTLGGCSVSLQISLALWPPVALAMGEP